MALIFCASGGSNTSPYETWAKAATSLQTAITAASTDDVVVLQYNAVPAGDKEVGADTTYTFDAHCSLVAASNDGTSAYTLRAMSNDSDWIGNSTTNRFVKFVGNDFRCLIWGLTIRTAGSTGDKIFLNDSNGAQFEYHSCYFWHGNSATGGGGSVISLASSAVTYTKCVDTTFRFGATGQYFELAGFVDLVNCSISSDGSTPTTLFTATAGCNLSAVGCDFSLVTGTLIGNVGVTAKFSFDRCKLGSAVLVLASQTTNPSKGSPNALVSDCASADTHGLFGYYDALGSVISDTGIYFTAGAAAQSWKIVTTANASYRTPFVTPPIALYNTGMSAITPYLEILRDGSTTAYTDAQVWAEFDVKVTASSTQSTDYTDRQALSAFLAGTAGSNQAAGAGLGSWTGESGTAWSGKIDSGASVTPAEVGHITARVVVGAASTTVYVDPEIRT